MNPYCIIITLVTALFSFTVSAAEPLPFSERAKVKQFIHTMQKKHQMDPATLTQYFHSFAANPKVLSLMSKQYEALPWYLYQKNIVTEKRIKEGVAFWKKNAAVLKRAEKEFGVPAEIIIAILGIETSYGQIQGKIPVLQSLSTLAFDYPRRAKFFKAELEQFLLLVQEGALDPIKTQGSFAGAMGMPQFMPSSYQRYAIDYSGTGTRDLIHDTTDVIGSVAHYLHAHGWQHNEKIAKKLSAPHKKSIPHKTHKIQYLTLKGPQKTEEYWVGYHNFYVITRYNHSVHYAMAVFQLAEKIKKLKRR